MSTRKTKVSNAPFDEKKNTAPPHSVAEMRAWYEQNKKKLERYEDAKNGLTNLRDVTKSSTKTVSAFSKDSLRNYLKNISSNEKNLRNLSRYLFYRSQVYYRLVMYNANMFELNARSVIPNYNLTEDNDPEAFLQSYEETLNVLDKMNLPYEGIKATTTCFREDIFYGCAYYDENADTATSMFILPLDPDYCKIDGIYQTGDFSFSMDMSYFKKNQTLLEYYGEPFQSMYHEYESTNVKWVHMQDEYGVCFKVRADDWETIVPPFSGLLNSLISLLDLEDIQSIADEQQIYKMIWIELETLASSKEINDWKIDPKIVIDYYNRMVEEALPDYTSAAIIPGKINTVSFNNDQATDTNKIEKATETVLNTSGGSQILNSASISGSTAFENAVLSDTLFAICNLLPQIQSWVNRFISYHVSNPAKVKFFEVSKFTKGAFRKELLENGQYGLPTQLAINTLNGFSEKDTLALNFLEQQCLKLGDKFKPMNSSHTQTGTSDGSNQKDESELSDEGEKSRDQEKSKM